MPGATRQNPGCGVRDCLNVALLLTKKKRVPKYSLNHHREEIARNGFIVFEVVYNYNNLAEDLSLRNLVDQ
jgi:hypothetical protein